MNLEDINKILSDGFKRDIFLVEKRPNLFQIFTPFSHPDGDMIDVFLSMETDGKFLIQDLGTTIMRLSYDFDIDSKNKRKVFNEIITNYQIKELKNNLYIESSENDLFPNVMQLIQVIIKVSDLNFLKRETVKSLFYEYFDKFIFDKFKDILPIKDWYPEFDNEKLYPSPYALVSKDKAICLFPIGSDEKCNETIITVQHYESHNFKPETIAVFENQEFISRKPLARLSNVVGKQFASLDGNQERIEETVSKYRKQLGMAIA